MLKFIKCWFAWLILLLVGVGSAELVKYMVNYINNLNNPTVTLAVILFGGSFVLSCLVFFFKSDLDI